MSGKVILTIIGLGAALSALPAAAEEGLATQCAQLLGAQRDELLKKGPFRIEFEVDGQFTSPTGVKPLPQRSGMAVLDASGRFLILAKNKADDPAARVVSSFAWDGENLYRTPDSVVTYFLPKAEFVKYADAADTRIKDRVPYVDMYEFMREPDPQRKTKALAHDGIGIPLGGFRAFDYMALHDLYFAETPGKIGPRWCDITNPALFALSAGLADAIVAVKNDSSVVTFRSGSRPSLRSGVSYHAQVLVGRGKGKSPVKLVQQVTHRGPWQSIARQSVEGSITPQDLDRLCNLTGSVVKFEYAAEVAWGLFPAKVVDIQYDQPTDIPAKDLVPGPDEMEITHGIQRRTLTWRVTGFEPLSPADAQLILDQYPLSQKRLEDLSRLPLWKALHAKPGR